MAMYERLSALDRFFLDVESSNTHMHVAAVMLFEAGPLLNPSGGIDIDRIRRYVGSRLHLIPRYRQRIKMVPIENHPVWVDDDQMNIRYHVRHTALPRPGTLRQLKRLAGRVMSQKLDRGKPLWEFWVVEGLENDRFAVITKTHHCMIDGISGVDLATVLLGLTPDAHVEDPPNWRPDPVPSNLELLRDEVMRRAMLPLDAIGMAKRFVSSPRAACRDAADMMTGFTQALDMGMRSASDTPLNRKVGSYRRFDWVEIDLADVKRVKNALGGTVNDVVLATVAGAAGHFLELRGMTRKQQERMDFRAFCPVSVRSDGDRGRMGNRVSGMIASLPIAETDPAARLRAVTETTRNLKQSKQALGAEVLAAVSDWTVPVLLSLGARMAARSRAYNLICTNIPGPQVPLYMLGSRLEEAYPLVPLFVNQALGIALFSYEGKLCWGFNADWDLMPDLHDFVEALASSFRQLRGAAEAIRVSSGATNGSGAADAPSPGVSLTS